MKISKEKIEKLFKRYEFCFGDKNYEFKDEINLKFRFFNILADKINLNPTVEKHMFFYTLLSYAIKDDVDFYFKSKQAFLRNFIFEKRASNLYFKKAYQYVSPVSLSLYSPEFYETINEIYEGEDVSMPYTLEQKDKVLTSEEQIEMKPFFDVLDEVKVEMLKNEDENFATIMVIDWLKSAYYMTNDEGWFYTSFRKDDVLKNDKVFLDYKDLDKFNLDNTISANKDMIVWNMLNSRMALSLKQVDKLIALNDLFFEKINLFFENK